MWPQSSLKATVSLFPKGKDTIYAHWHLVMCVCLLTCTFASWFLQNMWPRPSLKETPTSTETSDEVDPARAACEEGFRVKG